MADTRIIQRRWLRCGRKLTGSPVISASGRDCSFLQAGTKTVTSLWPLSKNQSTANFIPRQEKTSLFPWLKYYFRTLKIITKPKFDSTNSNL